jgi:hypothetical protein
MSEGEDNNEETKLSDPEDWRTCASTPFVRRLCRQVARRTRRLLLVGNGMRKAVDEV